MLSRTVWDRPRYALRDERFKFVYDTRTGEEELFDLAADPGETRDVAERGAAARGLLPPGAARLDAAARAPRPRRRRKRRGSAREQCENLKALGYIQGECK